MRSSDRGEFNFANWVLLLLRDAVNAEDFKVLAALAVEVFVSAEVE
jgi:hypothetical protein